MQEAGPINSNMNTALRLPHILHVRVQVLAALYTGGGLSALAYSAPGGGP